MEHISRDATAIEAREKPAPKPKAAKPKRRKRGRPRKGEARAKEPMETRCEECTKSVYDNRQDGCWGNMNFRLCGPTGKTCMAVAAALFHGGALRDNEAVLDLAQAAITVCAKKLCFQLQSGRARRSRPRRNALWGELNP